MREYKSQENRIGLSETETLKLSPELLTYHQRHFVYWYFQIAHRLNPFNKSSSMHCSTISKNIQINLKYRTHEICNPKLLVENAIILLQMYQFIAGMLLYIHCGHLQDTSEARTHRLQLAFKRAALAILRLRCEPRTCPATNAFSHKFH